MKNYRIIILFIFVINGLNTSLVAQNRLMNVFNRTTYSLDGVWQYIVDPYENGYFNYRYQPHAEGSAAAYFSDYSSDDPTELVEYSFDESPSMLVPGDWNTQDERLYYYEGTVWFRKRFDIQNERSGKRYFLHFGAVNYEAKVYLNGQKVGEHKGGFTPFHFEVTDLLKDSANSLVVKVDNRRSKEAVPTLNTDWWNYGGITRSIKLVEVPSTYIDEFKLRLSKEDQQKIEVHLKLEGPNSAGKELKVQIDALKLEKTIFSDSNGIAKLYFESDNIQYWSPQNPTLYSVSASTSEDELSDRIGFRLIETSGRDITLNGQSIFLKGISIHEESPFAKGRANSEADVRTLLQWAKELGCNYVRLAHYPHNEYMVRLADEMGLLVWSEIPVYWTIDWHNAETYTNAASQLEEMIYRDINRASVIIWSMANETPHSEERFEFLSKLVQKTRSIDSSRLISAALEVSRVEGKQNTITISDDFADQVDVLSFNQYIGWYDGTPEKCRSIQWEIKQNKPVLISEFGAGAKAGFHGDKSHRFTEEYQEYLYEETLKMLSRIPQLRGMTPWILVDFRSPRRVLPGIQDDWNRKGLISEKGERKKAFYTLQKFYKNYK